MSITIRYHGDAHVLDVEEIAGLVRAARAAAHRTGVAMELVGFAQQHLAAMADPQEVRPYRALCAVDAAKDAMYRAVMAAGAHAQQRIGAIDDGIREAARSEERSAQRADLGLCLDEHVVFAVEA